MCLLSKKQPPISPVHNAETVNMDRNRLPVHFTDQKQICNYYVQLTLYISGICYQTRINYYQPQKIDSAIGGVLKNLRPVFFRNYIGQFAAHLMPNAFYNTDYIGYAATRLLLTLSFLIFCNLLRFTPTSHLICSSTCCS